MMSQATHHPSGRYPSITCMALVTGVMASMEHTAKSNVDISITWEPENDLPFYGVKQHDGYELTIEER